MGILPLILLLLIIVFVISLVQRGGEKQLNQSVQWLKSIGTLGLVRGIPGLRIGLFSAFARLETVESISTEMPAGGLKVSLITTLYGLLIYIPRLFFAMVLRRWQPAL